jgi:hypothetical protein
MKEIEITPKQLLLLCILRKGRVKAKNIQEYKGSCSLYNEFARKINLEMNAAALKEFAEKMISSGTIKSPNIERTFIAYDLGDSFMRGFDLCELHDNEEIVWFWFASKDDHFPANKFEYNGKFLVKINEQEEYLLEKYS